MRKASDKCEIRQEQARIKKPGPFMLDMLYKLYNMSSKERGESGFFRRENSDNSEKSQDTWGFSRVVQRGGKTANSLVFRFVSSVLPFRTIAKSQCRSINKPLRTPRPKLEGW